MMNKSRWRMIAVVASMPLWMVVRSVIGVINYVVPPLVSVGFISNVASLNPQPPP